MSTEPFLRGREYDHRSRGFLGWTDNVPSAFVCELATLDWSALPLVGRNKNPTALRVPVAPLLPSLAALSSSSGVEVFKSVIQFPGPLLHT